MSASQNLQKLNRRGFLKLSGTIAGAAAIAACAPITPAATPLAGTAPNTATGATPSVPTLLKGATIKYLNYGWFVPKMNETFRNFAIDWATQNGVQFDLETIPTGDVATRVAAAIETKSGPNIVQIIASPASIAGAAVDLTQVASNIASQQDGWYAPAPFNSVVDGKWLSIPFGGWAALANYRKDWLKEVGYDAPPQTWQELLAAGTKLKAAGHPIGYSFTGSSGDGVQHALPLLWAYGGKEFNPDGTVALDSPETIAALEYAIQLYNDACDPGVTAYTDPSNNQAFLAGQISMTLNVNTIYLPARDTNPELAANIQLALPPEGPAGRGIVELVPSVAVLDHTQGANLDAAKAFLTDFFSVAEYAKFIKDGEGYMLPMGPRYETLPVWPTDPKLQIVRDVGKVSRPSGYDLPAQNKLSAAVYSRFAIGKLFSRACTTGDARASLDATMKEIEDLAKQS